MHSMAGEGRYLRPTKTPLIRRCAPTSPTRGEVKAKTTKTPTIS